MRTLHLCNRVPYPPHDGGAIGIYDIISNLARQGCQVTVLAVNTPKHYQPDTVLQGRARLLTVFVNTDLSPVKAFLNFFKKVPYNIERFYAEAYATRLRQLLQAEQFDIIQVEGSHMAIYVPLIRQYCRTPVVLRAHNVEYTIWQRLAQNEQNLLKKYYLRYLARKIKRFEQEYFRKLDAIAAISTEDEKQIRQLGYQGRLQVIPAGVELSRFVRDTAIRAKLGTLLMIGSLNWLPNLEGIKWFLTKVWPVVTKEQPHLELHLAGSAPPAWLLNLREPNIKVHGFVPSAAIFMQQYDLMLVPLLSGGGMRIKIIEGMALGKGILTTSVGAEGILAEPGKHLFILDDPADWIALLQSYAASGLPLTHIRENARQQIIKYYDNEKVVQQYLQLYRELRPV